ncbi:type II toxin-antitoxin system VapC family toxin [Phyllobacterium sp. LjRoot231]|uniref:type II toxin-antitoxin system VapC family toxin n=1 Tax=Phyllobacterium sp. LjRoot231 TaxID=3342289 RepID=UPI003ECC8314
MIFVDASAIISILDEEADASSLAVRVAGASTVFVSPMALYEAVTGLARKRVCPIDEAQEMVDDFTTATQAQIVEITAEIGRDAVKAFNTFGRGRHKAALNMGDCFAYACAKAHNVPLLFKGNEFPFTDIEIA